MVVVCVMAGGESPLVMTLMVIVVLVVTNLVVLVVKVGVVLVTPACCIPHLELTEGDVQQGEHRLHQPWHHLLHHHS